jgi:hypothetical protein
MRYSTFLSPNGDVVRVVTKPMKTDGTFVYPFRRFGDVWVMARERDWYTRHVVRFARAELDGQLVEKHLGPGRTSFDDYEGVRHPVRE